MSTISRPVAALLLDIGGVIIEIDFERAFHSWASVSGQPVSRIRANFEADPSYRLLETGALTITEYFSGLRLALNVDLTEDELAEGWGLILVDQITGIAELLATVSNSIPIYGLSNSNSLHWNLCFERFPEALKSFQGIFLSYELGFRKPDPRSFRAALRFIGFPPSEVVFLDDSPRNVEAGRKIGMQAFEIDSPTTMQAVLESLVELID